MSSKLIDKGGVTQPEHTPGEAPETDAPHVMTDDEVKAERRPRVPRERQFPALYGKNDVEVAERTPDTDTESTDVFTKDFVTLRREYDPERDAVHVRNVNAVRQYMVNLGLRPDADVEFVGEKDLGGPAGRESVSLRYRVRAIPAVVATQFDHRHTVIPQTGETATQRAQHDAERADRLRLGYDARRAGTPEAERAEHPEASARRSGRHERKRRESEEA